MGLPVMKMAFRQHLITRKQSFQKENVWDQIAVESPLEIRVSYNQADEKLEGPVSMTLRTPGADLQLVLGYLFCEGIIGSIADVVYSKIADAACAGKTDRATIELKLKDAFLKSQGDRRTITSSACGMCGKLSAAEIYKESPWPISPLQVEDQLLYKLAEKLRGFQPLFEKTGGTHGVGIFDTGGNLVASGEDVGRHNAVDKVIGFAFLKNQLPASELGLFLSEIHS